MKTIKMELVASTYKHEAGHFVTPSRFNAAKRDQHYRYNGRSFALGYVDATGSCRREQGGPVLPGPYAYSFGLGVMLVEDGAERARMAETWRNEIELKDGDVLDFNGVLFRVAPYMFCGRPDREHFDAGAGGGLRCRDRGRGAGEKVGDGASKSAPAEVKKYYDDNPALFKERRVYQLQELVIQASADQIDALRARLAAAKNPNEFIEYLKANNFQFYGNQVVRPAEQLPLASLDAFAKMKDGQMEFSPLPTGARVIVLACSRLQPVEFDQASPRIEQYQLRGWSQVERLEDRREEGEVHENLQS